MNKRLLKEALDAINKVFSDTSVSQETTMDTLRELRDDIEMKMECIRVDLKLKRSECG